MTSESHIFFNNVEDLDKAFHILKEAKVVEKVCST